MRRSNRARTPPARFIHQTFVAKGVIGMGQVSDVVDGSAEITGKSS